jgi:hypothetical protein
VIVDLLNVIVFMPTLEKIAEMGGISLRTVQRRVKEYNDLNGSRFGRGANDVIIDDEVLSFINEKRIGKKVVKNKGSNTSILRGDKIESEWSCWIRGDR